MLSIAIIKDSAAAASYYEQADDYYSGEQSPSAWQGNGSEKLGLSGAVDPQQFRALLDGRMPDGSQMHNAAEGRRAAIDLTFSAPKSVTMQALIGADTRLIDAHEKAVCKALQYAEGLANYRVTENLTTRLEQGNNLVVATFRHDLSRQADPQMHTHAVVVNATQRPDGQWRALEAGELLRQKMLLGALYRNELAHEVRKLGYEVRLIHTDGRFELAHINDRQVEAFSGRSQAIEATLAAQGKSRETASAQQKEVAALSSREVKVDVDRASLQRDWQQKSADLGIDYGQSTQALQHTSEIDAEQRIQAAREAVAFAVAHHSERQSVMTDNQLIRTALENGTGRTDLATIRAELAEQSRHGELIQVGNQFTTITAQQRERDILNVETRGRGSVTPILSEVEATRALVRTALNEGQRDAASLITTTDARVTAIQGAAGTGKTTMLREASSLATQQGYRVLGLAPSAAAARELNRAGIETQTLASLNLRENSGMNEKTLVVLDEAGMVSSRDMQQVLQKVEAAGARIVLVGDVQQLKAVEAGKPFAQLQEAGIARVVMGDIQRQNNSELRQAVELAACGEVERSLALLSRDVVEIERSFDRYQAIARDYADLPPDVRAGTLILAGTRAARSAINEQVRERLALSGNGMQVITLERKDLTSAQARSSLAYQAGDLLQAQRTYLSLGLERGELARVIETSPGRVTLQRLDGQSVEWRLAYQRYLIAYREQSRELSVGDVVRFTANDHVRGIVNGERATVTAIDAERQQVTLGRTDGSTVTLNTSQPLPLDHGYASTVHAAQGQTADRVLIEADTRSATTHESSYYVAISRARDEVTIYTDDKASLPISMGREDVKSAALDLDKSQHQAMER